MDSFMDECVTGSRSTHISHFNRVNSYQSNQLGNRIAQHQYILIQIIWYDPLTKDTNDSGPVYFMDVSFNSFAKHQPSWIRFYR